MGIYPVMLAQDEIPQYKQAIGSITLEKKDFFPLWGYYNFARRNSGAKDFKEFAGIVTSAVREFKRENGSVLENMTHLGTANWPRNEEIEPELMRFTLMNCALFAWNGVIALSSPTIYSGIKSTIELIIN
jgi:hypothetical protein